MGNDRYNVIVVGAGPAGITAAYHCAQNNLSVALIERGEEPGSKNMFGGVIYRKPFAEIIPEFWEKAPLERTIIEDVLWFLDNNSVVKMGHSCLDFASSPYNKFTVIRSKFDKWYAQQAENAGADLITSTLVEDIIKEKNGLFRNKVTGVMLENGDKIYADIVIIAEGGISNLVQKAELQGNLKPKDYELFVKELLALPEEKINERFNLEGEEGANIGIVGYPTSGIIGKAGIWTNKDTISLNVGAYLNQLIDTGLNLTQLLSRVKEHPYIKRLLKGSESIEYLSHIIPKAGNENMPRLYDSGVLVIGDALMNIGGEGTVLALISGRYAAETTRLAFAKRDFSADALSTYEKKLKNSSIMKDNLQATGENKYYQNYSDADLLLNSTLNNIAYEFFDYTMKSQKEKFQKIFEEINNLQPLDKTLIDFLKGIKNWRIL
ncbi:MAG: FAD-dependent oxidoreductase [Halanaerobiaceae bacterium]